MLKRILDLVIPIALIATILPAGVVVAQSFLGSSALAQRLVALDLYPDHGHHSPPLLTPTPTPQAVEAGRLSLPVILRQPAPTPAPWCDAYEPNDDRWANPWGPLVGGTTYSAKLCRGDTEDNYAIDMPRASSVTVHLQLPATLIGGVGVALYSAADLSQAIAFEGLIGETSFRLELGTLQAGRYIVRVYAEGAWDDVQEYSLQVTLP